MKKYLVTLAITALATSAFAQGTVVFNNNSSGLVKQWTSASDPTLISVPKLGGSVTLFAAAPGASLNPLGTVGAGGYTANYANLAAFLAANTGWAQIATTGILPIAAGQYNGGTQTIAGGAGANAQYFVVGWTGAFASYDAAMAAGSGFIGVSSVFATTTGNPTTVPPGTPVSLNSTFTGMTLATVSSVPEPSTFALAGLGAAALMIFRRRK